MKLLHLDSSIQGDNSASRAVTAAIVAQARAEYPTLDVTYTDLANAPLPHLTLGAIGDATGQLALEEFLAADIVVIGAGMYNFTIPSQLKAWIDRIVVAGRTFQYGANGVEGLVHAKRVIIALARGGLYGAGTPAASVEHAETYLRDVFRFLGVTDLEVIVAEGLAMGDESRTAAMTAAFDKAKIAASGVALAA